MSRRSIALALATAALYAAVMLATLIALQAFVQAAPARAAAPAPGDPLPTCGEEAAVMGALASAVEASDGADVAHVYGPANSARLIEAFNARPPVSHYAGERLVTLDVPARGIVEIGFETHGIVCGIVLAPLRGWHDLVRATIGAAS